MNSVTFKNELLPRSVDPWDVSERQQLQADLSAVKQRRKESRENKRFTKMERWNGINHDTKVAAGDTGGICKSHGDSVWKQPDDVGTLPELIRSLPLLHLDNPTESLQVAMGLPFSEQTLAWALQSSLTCDKIQQYLAGAEASVVRSRINQFVRGYPPLFYATQKNCIQCIRILLKFGGDPNIKSQDNLPLLAFLVCYAERKVINITEVVKTLLAVGANPTQIPSELWKDYRVTTTAVMPNSVSADKVFNWCTPTTYANLARGFHMTLRYFFYKASLIEAPSGKTKQVALAHSMIGVLQMPYYLIGQSYATRIIMERLIAHVTLKKNVPLVLLFAGTSGIGKTELAKLMGNLLSVDLVNVDCTKLQHESDLFGPKPPYQGHDKGSRVNNFLADHTGQRSVVFLDEFEKTSADVRNALLLPWDSGKCWDNRNSQELDCSRTIWVCATNHADRVIDKFFMNHLSNKSREQKSKAPLKSLSSELNKMFIAEMGAPICGRINLIVPFFPFSTGEQAVVAHKFILELFDNVRRPINAKMNDFIRHINLSVIDDGKVCKHIAEEGYHRQTGARSVARYVEDEIEAPLASTYLNMDHRDEPITEDTNMGPLQRYAVHLFSEGNEEEEQVLRVYRSGSTEIK